MNAPDLKMLQKGDPDAWDAVFRELWPVVYSVAQLKLKPFLPGDAEDVAIEALEELVEKVHSVKAVEELRPLAASIAHHRAVSLLRGRFAQKRGSGLTESLDAKEGGGVPIGGEVSSPFDDLEQKELSTRLAKSIAALKPPLGDVLSDFYLNGLRYEEIASKHGMAVGSVGVYLKRGLAAMRRIWSGAKGERNES